MSQHRYETSLSLFDGALIWKKTDFFSGPATKLGGGGGGKA